MKTVGGLLGALLAGLLWPLTAQGQGQFFFSNRDLSTGVNARFILPTDPPGTSSVGGNFQSETDFRVALFGGPEGTPVRELVPLDPPSTTFRGPAGALTAGYVTPVFVTVPGAPFLGTAEVLVRVFNGPSWEGATYRFEGIYLAQTGFEVPPTLPMGLSPLVLTAVPEPSALVLALIGLVALALVFREGSPSACARAKRRMTGS